MGYLFGGGQVVVGIGVIMAWWLALKLDRLRLGGRPLSRMGFAVSAHPFSSLVPGWCSTDRAWLRYRLMPAFKDRVYCSVLIGPLDRIIRPAGRSREFRSSRTVGVWQFHSQSSYCLPSLRAIDHQVLRK
jgi:hypothetical protein